MVTPRRTIISLNFYVLGYESETEGIIFHDITETLTVLSSAFLAPLFYGVEDGSSTTYKLTNAADDSGWLTASELSSFTAFATKPTGLQIKLTPKTTTPFASCSIKGAGLRLE